jgi:peptidoglycan/LPS O-acetylase OafA/YrhL
MVRTQKIEAIQSLRGLASLAVAWFHLTERATYRPLNLSGMYGGRGVDVFFVISGFIIPYALSRSNYKLRDFRTFIIKRIIRLEPPYFISILIVLTLFLSTIVPPWLRGEPHETFVINGIGLALHLGYLNGYFGYAWLNPVYWTLAVESQYYLLIGLLFPLLASHRTWLRVVTFVTLGSLSLFYTSKPYIGNFVFLFLMGILTWQFRSGLVNNWAYVVVLIGLIFCSYMKANVASTVAGMIAISVILLGRSVGFLKSRILLALGDISYSLYLVHFSVGIHFINVYKSKVFAGGAPSPTSEALMIFLALAVSLFSAYLCYKLVEQPARKFASSIAYERRS